MAKIANKPSRFRPGARGGCEALLWEFKERPHLDDTKNDLADIPAEPPGVVLIAAETLDEALKYLRFDSPDFDVHTVNCLGLIIMISGTPTD